MLKMTKTNLRIISHVCLINKETRNFTRIENQSRLYKINLISSNLRVLSSLFSQTLNPSWNEEFIFRVSLTNILQVLIA